MMKKSTDLSSGEFQKLIQLALQYLTIRQTLIENELANLRLELRTLEREEQLTVLERELHLLQQDYQRYQAFSDPTFRIDWESYYR